MALGHIFLVNELLEFFLEKQWHRNFMWAWALVFIHMCIGEKLWPNNMMVLSGLWLVADWNGLPRPQHVHTLYQDIKGNRNTMSDTAGRVPLRQDVFSPVLTQFHCPAGITLGWADLIHSLFLQGSQGRLKLGTFLTLCLWHNWGLSLLRTEMF